ncbi:MAG: lipopolysaccharide transport periplasmic protein LptA [Gammaproteobacteria bacterium]
MPMSKHGFFPEIFSRERIGGTSVNLAWRVSLVVLTMMAGLALPTAAHAAAADKPQIPVSPLPTPANSTLPIDLDASFSEFDRRNNRLLFRQLTITQGTLVIKADEATADPANFVASAWVFTGNVQIDSGNTRATSDRAELTFRDNQLLKAALTGQPARFSQAAVADGATTQGRAQQLDYDLVGGTIQLITNAYLSDGKNEIAGNRIDYDLKREVVTADAADGEQVRMRFTPQKKPAIPGKTPPDKKP